MRNPLPKPQANINQFSQEAAEILELLDEIETRTIELRKKLVSELNSYKGLNHIKLDVLNNNPSETPE